jgi:polysaccharide biosynthesis PFTS motif protein
VFEALNKVAQAKGINIFVVKKNKRIYTPTTRWPVIIESEMFRKTPAGLVFLPLNGNFPIEMLLQKASVVISLPITTPGIAAKIAGIPSCYLDPLGNVDKTDPSLRNIPIFSESTELEFWLATHLPN